MHVLGRQVDRLATVERRAVEAGLRAGVERLEPATGGEPDREARVELVHRRIVLDNAEWGGRTTKRLGP